MIIETLLAWDKDQRERRVTGLPHAVRRELQGVARVEGDDAEEEMGRWIRCAVSPYQGAIAGIVQAVLGMVSLSTALARPGYTPPAMTLADFLSQMDAAENLQGGGWFDRGKAEASVVEG